ncbi:MULTISPECIES: hypothetical protein [Paraburkholderia]|uniref:Uncharacterized protein n=1 Tax=Paraburkholderia tuberum TaxID=157910 RepID=A0A1H1GPG0_9BURK|nr:MULTISPECIES: hypothetical protein [Paraburkholderia]MBB5459510.1 hypothetical protein [Paraburkholderia sp. Cpub6]SDR14756.1 hypothetical protein SAMN05445850_2993 [Paraburkholderia tuberum]
MTIDDADLLAYVDRTLAHARVADIERAMHESVDIANRVIWLMASKFPYTEIVGRQSLPALPVALRLRIDRLIAAA